MPILDFEGQMSLTDLQEHNKIGPVENTCGVFKDGAFQDIAWNELFGNGQYDTLECVTYVSSPGFFAKAVSGYKKAKIVIGIEKESVRKAFSEGIANRIYDKGTQFFEELPDDCKKRLIDAEIEVRYAKPDTIIHSKMYLLSNTSNEKTRLIIGSANLTNSAFDNHVRQYEDVMVFDNSPAFNEYKNRFNQIYQSTEDYIPRETREKYTEGKIIKVVDLTAEEKTEAILDVIRKGNLVPLCTDTVLKGVEEDVYCDKVRQQETRTAFEVITAVSKKDAKSQGSHILKSAAELGSVKPKITDILFKATKTELDIARFALSYNNVDKCQYIVYPRDENGNESRPSEIFDKKATDEEICASVNNLNQFIDAYSEFVSEKDTRKDNLARIYEIIMYAFTSAYMFKLREDISGSKSDIPIILVIGGRAASGKSNLLAYIDRILSGRNLSIDSHFLQYKNVKGKNIIENLFMSENTYPLLIDEVDPSFFSGKRGEELIKGLSNSLSGKHPVMICTTNTGAFNMPSQVSRRIYYLQVDSCFDLERKQEANKYYEKVMEEATNALFRDYCFRMAEKIRLSEDLFGDGGFDYLRSTREIFEEYYKISGIELPEYFPHGIYNDYAVRGKNMWETLFEQKRELFSYSEQGKNGEPQLTINLKEAVATSSRSNDADVYLNYLKQDLLVEDAGVFVKLRANPFFKWIGVRNPWEKRTLLEKLFNK